MAGWNPCCAIHASSSGLAVAPPSSGEPRLKDAAALAGLSRRVRALSFEFTTIQRGVGLECVERCAALGYTRFNAVIGETHRQEFAQPVDAQMCCSTDTSSTR